jgi:hypothetical protein
MDMKLVTKKTQKQQQKHTKIGRQNYNTIKMLNNNDWVNLGLNLDFRGGKPATNTLSHDMTPLCYYKVYYNETRIQ